MHTMNPKLNEWQAQEFYQAIINKTKNAIENSVNVYVHSIQKQIAKIGATEANINHSEIHNFTFDMSNTELKKTHIFVKTVRFWSITFYLSQMTS